MPFLDIFGPPDIDRLMSKRDVQGLMKALSYKKDAKIQQAAAKSLGQIGGLHVIELLAAFLQQTADSNVRAAAITALGWTGDERSVKPIVESLAQGGEDIQAAKMEALAKLGPSAVKPLIEMFGGASDKDRQAASMALVKIGQPAIEPLVAALQNPDRRILEVAATTLHALGWQPQADTQSTFYAVAQGDWKAVIALGKGAVEPLVRLLKQGVLTEQVANALGQLRDGRAVESLTAELKTPVHPSLNSGTEQAVIDALAEIGDTAAVTALVELLKEAEFGRRQQAALGALVRLGDRAAQPLAETLREQLQRETSLVPKVQAPVSKKRGPKVSQPGAAVGTYKVSTAIAAALGQVGTPAVIAPLVALVDIPGAEAQAIIIATLTQIDPDWRQSSAVQAAIPEYVGRLQHQKIEDWLTVINTLDRIDPNWHRSSSGQGAFPGLVGRLMSEFDNNPNPAKAALRSLLKNADPLTAAQVAKGLGIIGQPNNTDRLFKTLAIYGISDEVRYAIVKALLQLGHEDPSAVEAIARTLPSDYMGAMRAMRELGWSPTDPAQSLIWQIENKQWQTPLEAMSLVSNKSEPDSLARGQLFADIASNSPLRRLGAAAETALIVRSVRKVLVDSERDYVSQIAATFQEFDLIRTIEILTQVFGDIHENAGDLASLRVQRSVVRILAEIASAQVVALLISMTENKNVAFQASHALQKILDENASAVSPDNLLAITQLGNNKVSQIQYSWNSQCQTEQREGEYAVDCSQVIQLARQELIQRGLTA